MMSGTHNLNGNGTTTYDPERIALGTKAALNNYETPPPPMKKTLCQGTKETYFEYCSNTSIHGIQYLGRDRPWKERIFWMCVFIVSLGCCINAIENIYNKWVDTPVIVSFSESSTEIWKIPFPAVTICSETKRSHRTGPSFKELQQCFFDDPLPYLSNMSSTELEEFLTLLQICDYVEEEQEPFKKSPIDYIRVLNEMLPESSIFLDCEWIRKEDPQCSGLFTKTYTEEGICFTFNGLNATDLYRENTVQYEEMGLKSFAAPFEALNRSMSWSLQDGYAAGSELFTYPARVLSSGSKAGLAVYLSNLKKDTDYGCRGASQGFKLILHSPDDAPVPSSQFVRLSMGEEMLISVKPIMMTTSDGIANHPPEKRQCYLAGERYLRFFKIYTENNCELECLTNFTLALCKCVKFSMPRTSDMPVCAEGKINCYDTAEDKMMYNEFSGASSKCNCLPSCTSLQYDTEISQGSLDVERAIKAFIDGIDLSEFEFSSLSIYFKYDEFITSKRSELYNFYDFLASCGGILGLFMGVSILSFVEILYHFTLRLWTNMKRKDDVN